MGRALACSFNMTRNHASQFCICIRLFEVESFHMEKERWRSVCLCIQSHA